MDFSTYESGKMYTWRGDSSEFAEVAYLQTIRDIASDGWIKIELHNETEWDVYFDSTISVLLI